MSWNVEIQDTSLVWQSLSNGQIASISSGTSSESQIIPDFGITFKADIDIPAGLLDPETNRDNARLRITDGSTIKYFRIEKHNGKVDKDLSYPNLSGTAYAGIVKEWLPVTVDFLADITAADMARQICTRNVASQTGESIGVVWLATQNPTIPGGRFQVSRRERWGLLKEIVEMCGALLRVSNDGLGFEVYDHPAKALTDAATRTFTEAQSFGYELLRVKQPGNAVRVRGEQADYTRPQLPVVVITVAPTSIVANGTSTAEASATVYDSAGLPVQHKAIIDEAITAGSYTIIPVTDCYSVEAVWLNTGTAQAPVKGARITPTSFTASAITVPTQTTQLFIVSYTRAESVSFNLADQSDEIIGEAQNTTGTLTVSTTNALGRIIGVYRATDTRRTGPNYYTGGSATPNTTSVTLGISPGPAGFAVIIDYENYNGTPLSASISPASALCDANGQATATIGAGTTVGTAKITASALGQEASAWLSLLGSAIDSIALDSDKAQILVGSTIEGQTNVSETNLTVQHETIGNGLVAFDGYVVVQNPVAGSVQITSALDVQVSHYKTVGNEHRIYMRITNPSQYFTIGTSTVDVSYNTSAEIENDAGTCTITATVTKDDDTAVSDGTQVDFSITGLRDCELSSYRVYTNNGVATTTLTAGNTPGNVYVYAMCGSQRANIKVEVVRVITDDSEVGTVSYPSGTGSGTGDDSGDSGDISGKRRLICDGVPHAGVQVTLCDGDVVTQTDSGGYFSFDCGVTGENSGTATIDGEDYDFIWTCD